jgi:hypothetical protein
MTLLWWEWVVLGLATAVVGVAKAGVSGLGTLAVIGYASVLPARASTGILLPVLIVGDLVAIAVYRSDADWRVLKGLPLWVALGIGAGVGWLTIADDALVRRTIGVVVLVGVVLSLVLRRAERRRGAGTPGGAGDGTAEVARPGGRDASGAPNRAGAALAGTAAGFATMVANAAGPLTSLYFVQLRLPVRAFVGTAAWFYFAVNLAKVPFSVRLGLLDVDGLLLALPLLPLVGVGAVLGVRIVRRISQQRFEAVVLVLAAVACVPLLAG